MSAPTFKLDDLFSVAGTVAVITGGGTGLGKAIASAYATNGAKVFITGRRKEVLDNTATELNATAAQGGKVIAIQGDVSTKAGAAALYDAIKTETDVVDVLFNCAGVLRPHTVTTSDHNDPEQVLKVLWDGHDDVEFDYTNQININGVYFVTVALAPLLIKSDLKSVVVVASIAGLINQRAMGSVSYGVSKAGTIQLASLLAGRLSPMKIRVNTICPGIFPSEMTGQAATSDRKGHGYNLGSAADKAGLRSVVGRAGLPHEIAGPALLLGSRAGSYMDDACLVVDGGRSMVAGIHDGLRLPENTYN